MVIVMLSSIRSLVCLLVSISSVTSLAVPPAQSDPQNLNLASLVLAEHVNLTSIPLSLGNPPKELGAFAWECSERTYGHKLETHNVAEAFRKIPNNPAPMVFSKTPAPGEGAVKVPARFLGIYLFRTRLLRTLLMYTDQFPSRFGRRRKGRVHCHHHRCAPRCCLLDGYSEGSRPARPKL